MGTLNRIARALEYLSMAPAAPPKICFLHVPKCGGTSIDTAIKRSFGLSRYWYRRNLVHLSSAATLRGSKLTEESLLSYEEKILAYLLSLKTSYYVSGHFPYSQRLGREFGSEWQFITILRHPVERYFSHYFYNRYKQSEHFRIDVDLETFINQDLGLQLGSYYIRYLVGPELPDAELRSDAAIAAAIANLKQFTLAGALDRLEDFSRAYRHHFGRPVQIGRSNPNPASRSQQQAAISDAIRKQVEAICMPDLEVYNFLHQNLLDGRPQTPKSDNPA